MLYMLLYFPWLFTASMFFHSFACMYIDHFFILKSYMALITFHSSDPHLWNITWRLFGTTVRSTSSKTSKIISSFKYIFGYTYIFSLNALGSCVSQNSLCCISVFTFQSIIIATPCNIFLSIPFVLPPIVLFLIVKRRILIWKWLKFALIALGIVFCEHLSINYVYIEKTLSSLTW